MKTPILKDSARPQVRVRRCLALLVASALAAETASAAATFVGGLAPDWNQPYFYTAAAPNGGPGPDPAPVIANQWNAWCAPCSVANLAGHWADARGIPVADAVPFWGSAAAWAAGASWQDYLGDGFARPPPQIAGAGLPAPPTDTGWYLDTNLGVLYDNGLGTMGGFAYGNPPHIGTYLKDIHIGLEYYLLSLYGLPFGTVWNTGTEGGTFAAGYDPAGNPATTHANEGSAFAQVVSEIDTNRTLILSYRHWALVQTIFTLPLTGGTNTESDFGGTFYIWSTQSPTTNAEDEVWNGQDNGTALGHAVTAVGYILAGDADDKGPQIFGPGVFVNWVIVHDNWSSTPRNVIIPYYAKNAPWVANTTAAPVPTGVRFVKGLVPDWNQPYRYTVQSQNGGPGPDPAAGVVNQWNAWCAPCSAANLAGHWADYHLAPVADTTPFPGSTFAWAAPSWQDYLADGTNRPPPQPGPAQGPLPTNVTDIGWYMDTNLGVPYDDASGNIMGGLFWGNPAHTGTYLKDIDVGLQPFLNSLYSIGAAGWLTGTQGKGYASGVDPTGGVAQLLLAPAQAFGEVVAEVTRSRTLILSYRHWNISALPVNPIPVEGSATEAQMGGTYYKFESSPGSSNAEDEEWNLDDNPFGLGHAVTAVGYIPAGDLFDPGPRLGMGPTDWVIVHDNWLATPRNVVVPFDFANNWVANTSAGPDPAFLQFTGLSVTNGTNVVVRFNGLPGCRHVLIHNDKVTNVNWSVAVSNVAFAPWTMTLTNDVTSADKIRFYRLRANE